MITNGDNECLKELSEESLLSFNDLVGKTPFSFFKDFTHPVVIFKYYEEFTDRLINDICSTTHQKFETNFEYLVNPNINAGCRLKDGKNKIFVYEGTILSLYAYSSVLSCSYNTISANVDTSKYHIVHNMDIEMQYANYPSITTSLLVSSIPEENVIAEYIAMIAIKFVILHEIGHILSGHLLYRHKRGEIIASFYMSETNSSITDNLDLQTMEIDADSFAICQILSLLETELLEDQLLLQTVKDIPEIYKIIGCAIQCVFYLIGILNNQWFVDYPSSCSHPPALTRVNLILDTCRNTISGKDADKKYGYILQGIIMAQKNLCDYFNKDFHNPEQFVLDVIGKNEYGIMLIKRWRDLKKEILCYTALPSV